MHGGAHWLEALCALSPQQGPRHQAVDVPQVLDALPEILYAPVLPAYSTLRPEPS